MVKLKFFDFKQTTHEEISTSIPTKEDFQRLLEKAWERRAVPVRLISLGVRMGSNKKSSRSNSAQLKFGI